MIDLYQKTACSASVFPGVGGSRPAPALNSHVHRNLPLQQLYRFLLFASILEYLLRPAGLRRWKAIDMNAKTISQGMKRNIHAVNYTLHNDNDDGIDRRGFLECMAWAGAGLVWTFSGGVAHAQMTHHAGRDAKGELSFVQISDSHIGFNKPANPDVVGTLQQALDKIKALPSPPAFLMHTGDISHLSKPEQFDTVEQAVKGAGVGQAFYVPGEHDVLIDDGKQYLERFGKGAAGGGWYSFDQKGVHFIGLVNVLNLKAGGLGNLGAEQLAWLEKDVQGLSSSTPIVVFAHIPLWTVYPDWGWGTADGAQVLAYLKRFGSVTVLNGHIHQTLQKVEGNVAFHTAMSTAFPQPAPGSAPSPGPMQVPAGQLRSVLGITSVSYVQGRQSLAVVDSALAADSAKSEDREVSSARA
jgi:hypothetical protein